MQQPIEVANIRMSGSYELSKLRVLKKTDKTTMINVVMQSKWGTKLDLTVEDIEPYWLEFRLMADKQNVLGIAALDKLLNGLNVSGSIRGLDLLMDV